MPSSKYYTIPIPVLFPNTQTSLCFASRIVQNHTILQFIDLRCWGDELALLEQNNAASPRFYTNSWSNVQGCEGFVEGLAWY